MKNNHTENTKVSDLKPSLRNPRKISDKHLEMLGKSMKEFGDLSGIVFNLRTGNVCGGHQRIKHLDPFWDIKKQEHVDEVGTKALGYIETPFGKWNYREVDWDEKKEIAANIAANKHGGEFDFPMLKDIVTDDIGAGDIDLELTGFSEVELKDLFEEKGNKEKKQKVCPACGAEL